MKFEREEYPGVAVLYHKFSGVPDYCVCVPTVDGRLVGLLGTGPDGFGAVSSLEAAWGLVKKAVESGRMRLVPGSTPAWKVNGGLRTWEIDDGQKNSQMPIWRPRVSQG